MPHLPEPIYNYDTEQARESIRKLAALEPAAAWPGHAKPATGDVRAQLERAAAEREPRGGAAPGAGSAGRERRAARAPSSDYTDTRATCSRCAARSRPASRREYARGARGGTGPLSTREDAWQRAVELLFERLAVRWVIAGAPIERQRELLARLRVASSEERAWVREVLREHCAEHFPDVKAP